MEEDIKVLEEFAHDILQDYINDPNEVSEYDKKISKAIENLIKGYKELEAENEELRIIKSGIKSLETNFASDDTYYVIGKRNFLKGDYNHLLDDYISKSKVIEKIEELKQTSYYIEGEAITVEQVEILEELLEEGDTNETKM